MDHETLRGWLDQEADGGLDPAERALMVAHLAECADCRHELDELRGVGAFLAAGRVEARQGFDAAVMSALPAAGWEGRNREAWRLPLALLALLGGTAAILFGVSAARLEPGAAFFNAASAIADLFASAALAGAGLLAASWKGLGMGVAQLLLGEHLRPETLELLLAGGVEDGGRVVRVGGGRLGAGHAEPNRCAH